MVFQDYNFMESPARRFLDFLREICYNSITTLFPPSESIPRIQAAQSIDMEINSSVDSLSQGIFDASTPKFQSKNGTDKWGSAGHFDSPKPRDQSEFCQETGSKQLFARSVAKMENIESTPDFFGETQAIKQQKLGGGRTRQIIDSTPFALPHKLSPDRTAATDLCSSSAKDCRKVYVRQNASTCTSVAEMVKRFESRTGEVYVQKTITPPVSATPSVSVTEIVKQFEYKTREGCELDCIVAHEKELDRGNRQIMEQVEDQRLIIEEQPIMKHSLLPYPGKVRKPLMDIFELDSKFMKEKENVYKRFREEENECAKTEEERGELKRSRKTSVLNAKPFPKFSKEITLPKSPSLLSRQRNINKMSGSSPATNMR
ncbi:hypothetical protein ACHQM5_011150 [Ranunculus cassubicifolius]